MWKNNRVVSLLLKIPRSQGVSDMVYTWSEPGPRADHLRWFFSCVQYLTVEQPVCRNKIEGDRLDF